MEFNGSWKSGSTRAEAISKRCHPERSEGSWFRQHHYCPLRLQRHFYTCHSDRSRNASDGAVENLLFAGTITAQSG